MVNKKVRKMFFPKAGDQVKFVTSAAYFYNNLAKLIL